MEQYHQHEQWCSYTYSLLNNKKSPFNKNNVATIKTNKILTRFYYYALMSRCNGADVMKEESKSNSIISTNSSAHTLTHDPVIKKPIQ